MKKAFNPFTREFDLIENAGAGFNKHTATATAGQTDFPLPFFLNANSLVLVNGDPVEYTGVGSTTVVLQVACDHGDEILILNSASETTEANTTEEYTNLLLGGEYDANVNTIEFDLNKSPLQFDFNI